MNALPFVLAGTLAALPLLVALYMWRSGDYREERAIFLGCFVLASFPIISVLNVTVLLSISAVAFAGIVLWGIASIVHSARKSNL